MQLSRNSLEINLPPHPHSSKNKNVAILFCFALDTSSKCYWESVDDTDTVCLCVCVCPTNAHRSFLPCATLYELFVAFEHCPRQCFVSYFSFVALVGALFTSERITPPTAIVNISTAFAQSPDNEAREDEAVNMNLTCSCSVYKEFFLFICFPPPFWPLICVHQKNVQTEQFLSNPL